MNPPGAVLENQSIVLHEGRILALGTREPLLERFAVDEIQSRPTHALLPGFVDAGARFGARPSVSHGIAESLRAGITSFAVEDARVAELARAVAALHLHAVIGLPFGLESLWDEYRGDPHAAFCFAPGNAALLDDATLTRLRSVADELEAPIALDAHASIADVDEGVRRFGMRPLARLDQLGLLRPGVLLHGMTALDASDLDRIESRAVAVVARPETDLRASQSHAPLAALRERGILTAVGTSATQRTQTFDLLAQARLAGLLNGLDASGILGLATLAGAQAIGLGDAVGSLEPGKVGDLIAVDLATLATRVSSTEDVVNALAFASSRRDVSDVWLSGRAAVHHGRLLAYDEETLLAP